MTRTFFLQISIITILLHLLLCITGNDTDKVVQRLIKGTVKDLSGNPVSGAVVSLNSDDATTVTDQTGSYSIDITNNDRYTNGNQDNETSIDTLIIKNDGYLDRSFWLFNNSSVLDAVMWESTFKLVSSDLQGWIEQADRFTLFDTTQLYSLINGGATVYIEQNIIDGTFQTFEKSNGSSCNVFLYNCTSDQCAKSLFTVKSVESSASLTLDGYDSSFFIGSESLGGAVFYVHIGHFYIELELSGYQDQEQLKSDAIFFFLKYKSLIDSIM